MKLVSLSAQAAMVCLVATFVCAQTPKSAPADASPQPDPLQEQIVAHERSGLDALKIGDLATFAASTADDAVFVDSHGPASKAEVVEHTAGFHLHDYTMSDVRFVPVSADSGLIVYTLAESGESHGKEFTARVYVSSLWIRRGGKWVCAFSQETGAK
jgi:ketosteroid isomerase-like protein